ncbi:MAG: rod shape-determining protein MreD [Hydrogenophaga sp.]|jgi:rod shape-determining protein MreD|uniref:rod shape-determining protein MreD n=1 Tax=unclassified Hydrogenophaga TaxID=2610897 RepID=UPI0025BD6FB5|nr:rod shape-determining protein MreD [Hydrogenophaga sp.]MBU7574594.1 rod shape-determining protein MreD [Hydrogenophaga sp.]
MIMRPGQQLLLPANPGFIWFSLLAALVFNMLMNMGLFGRAAWVPDLLAVVLVFWSVHQPLRIGVGVAFAFGLAMDVHQGALLGQHALAYTALGFLGISMHRRLLWFSVPNQSVQVLPLFVAAHVLELLVRMAAGGSFPGVFYLLAPVIEAALWPVVSVLLLAPQRRAPNPDDNRPL